MAGPPGMVLRTNLMAELERFVGDERALAVVNAGPLQLGIYEQAGQIVVARHHERGWIETRRHEFFWDDAVQAVGVEIDRYRLMLPESTPSTPHPIVVLPATESYQALLLTESQVRIAVELFSAPANLSIYDAWPSFSAALDALGAEYHFC